MQPITAALLGQIALRPVVPLMEQLAEALTAQLVPAGFDTPLRQAHFLAQVCEEMDGFTRLEENLNYTHAFTITNTFEGIPAARAPSLVRRPEALANAAYANRWGNGDEASGDGWRYRGRGCLDHTYRDNYSDLYSALDLPFLTEPDRLLDPATAVRAGIYFFKSRGCLELADADDTLKITLKINGGTNGLVARGAYKREALKLLQSGSVN